MILVNKTRWSSEDLTVIINTALHLAGITSHARERVLVSYSKGKHFTGWAFYGHVKPLKYLRGANGLFLRTRNGEVKTKKAYRMSLAIPRPENMPEMYVHKLVWLVRHEVAHWQGLSHKQMHEKLYNHYPGHPNPKEFDNCVVSLMAEVVRLPKPVPDKSEERMKEIERAKKMLDKATERRQKYEQAVKRSMTIEKKWLRKISRLEANALKAARSPA